MNDYLPRILDIISESIPCDRKAINGGTRLEGDYALDELDVCDISLELLEEFGVEITMGDIETAQTPGDIAAHVERAKA